MRKRLVLVAALAATGCAFGTEWPSGGDVTIPAGETWFATEADMAKVNALSSITVEGSNTTTVAGVLEFQNCATMPKAGLLKGSGVVKKLGNTIWDWNVANADFDGDFRICGGQIRTSVAKTFGKTADGCKGAVYVEDGASLKITATAVKFEYRPIHIAGNGFGMQAEDKALSIIKAASGAIGRLYLDADATIYVKNDSNHYWLSNQATPTGIAWLGDYTLTKTGTMNWYFLGPTYNGGSLVNAEGSVTFRENTDLGDWDAGIFEFVKDASADFYNNPKFIKRPMKVHGKVTLGYSTNQSSDNSHPLLRTNCCNWAGNVLLNGTAAQLVYANTFYKADADLLEKSHNVQISFMGDVSGEGSVVVGNTERTAKGRFALGGHNTYTGTTTVYGGLSSRLYAYWHDSIPDYAKLTVDRGYVAAAAGLAADGETERWPKAKLFALHNTATFKEDGALAIDASGCEGGVFELTAAELLANDRRPEIGWGAAGGTVRITAEEGERLPIVPCAYRGTLELSGPGTFVTGGTNAIATTEGTFTNGAAVVVKDGATVEQGVYPVFVGRKHNTADSDRNPKGYATLVVSNAQWLSTCSERCSVESYESLHTNALYVGSVMQGVLDIQDGGFVSNKVVIGGGGHWNKQFGGDGAVYVGKGGRLYVRDGGNKSHIASQLGYAGYGYLQVEPGATVGADGTFSFGAYGMGVYHQYGGTFTKSGNTTIASCNGGRGVIYVTNGVLRTEGTGEAYITLGTGGSSARVFVTLDGPEAELNVGGTDRSLYLNTRNDIETRMNVNNGARLTVDRLSSYKAASESVLPDPIIIGFDGGVLSKATDKWSELISSYAQVFKFAVYAKGMTFDTGACKGNVWPKTCPIVGHVEGGVQSVDATKALAKNWIGAPYVTISGDGVGATAVADWDWKARRLKGIRITSHGWGYTQGAVTVTVKSAFTSVTINGGDVTVGANEIGGFTKLGEDVLTISTTNSWQKWTAVNGGTLKAGSNGAIPSGTELRLNGGTLDLGHFDEDAERPVSFTGLVGTGGAVVNGAAKLTGEWRISAQKFLDRESTAIEGTLDLSAVTKIVLTDAELLDDAAAQLARLALFSATEVVWPENLVFEGVPDGWSVRRTANGLKLGFDKGLMLILR